MTTFSHHAQVCNSGNKKPIIYPALSRRTYLLIENRSVAEVYINFGRSAGPNDGIRLYSGGVYELENAVPSGEIHLAGSSPTDQLINVTEGF